MPTREISTPSLAMFEAITLVIADRYAAIDKHGSLKAGPVRWKRLILEEFAEANNELAAIRDARNAAESYQARLRAVEELGQLAQLCIGVIELIRAGRIEEEV